MRQGDQGDDVRRLQRALVARGFDLPRYGIDGDFGRETTAALRRFAQSKRYPWAPSDDVPDELLELLGLEPDDEPIPPCDELDLEGVELYDLRDECPDAHPKSRVRGGKTVMRGAGGIDSIVLHQTAVLFGGSPELKLARRSLRVACHAMAFYEGFLAWPVDLRAYIYHADRLNSRSLGLEVDGNYPGLIGGPSTNSKPVTPVTEAVVHAACMGVKLLVVEGRRAKMPIKYIYAHRQADAWRRADPGQELYQRVVLEYAVPVLGLETRPAETFRHPKTRSRDGWPVPEDWDPERGVGRY